MSVTLDTTCSWPSAETWPNPPAVAVSQGREMRDCGLSDTVSPDLCSLTFIETASKILQAEAVLDSRLLNKCFSNDNRKKQELFVHGIVPGASGRFSTTSTGF